jgi:hypothetical protein
MEELHNCTVCVRRQCTFCGDTQWTTETTVGLFVSADGIEHALKQMQAQDPEIYAPTLRAALRSDFRPDQLVSFRCDAVGCPSVGGSLICDGSQDCSSSVGSVGLALQTIPRMLVLWLGQREYGAVKLSRPVVLVERLEIEGVSFVCDWIAVDCGADGGDSEHSYCLIRHKPSGHWLKVDDEAVAWMDVFSSREMRPYVRPSGKSKVPSVSVAAVGYSVVPNDLSKLESRNEAGIASVHCSIVPRLSGGGSEAIRGSTLVQQTAGREVQPLDTGGLAGTAPRFGGYPNGGNTCSYASVLQALQHQPQFLDQLQAAAAQESRGPWLGVDPRPMCRQLMELMTRSRSGAAVPLGRHPWLAGLNDNFHWGEQEDAICLFGGLGSTVQLANETMGGGNPR